MSLIIPKKNANYLVGGSQFAILTVLFVVLISDGDMYVKWISIPDLF